MLPGMQQCELDNTINNLLFNPVRQRERWSYQYHPHYWHPKCVPESLPILVQEKFAIDSDDD